ncbi:MAG TPA: hypothetical protein VGD22_03815 [Sphingobacteriaceae bacterium]
MKHAVILLFLCIFSGSICLAQGPASNGSRATATSEIRVSIPSFAVINLAKNNSKSVDYNTSANFKDIKLNSATKVEANNKWSVNVIRENNTSPDNEPSKSSSPTYTVIYVTTQI